MLNSHLQWWVTALVLTGLGALPVGAQHAHGADSHPEGSTGGWRMAPMTPGMPMLSGLEASLPDVSPFLPGLGLDVTRIPESRMREVLPVADGDTIELEATYVRRRVKDHTFLAYGFNGQYPGPLIEVQQDSHIFVLFRNSIDLPGTVHWHGVRVENRFDGVPGLTQELVEPGETFMYRVDFPDAGIYWYHPHHREDLTVGLGLLGNLRVHSADEDYYGSAHRDEVLILDDLLFDGEGLFPFGAEAPTHALMGRFGNVLLVNGEPDHRMTADAGEVVRFHFTNASSTRTYNLSFGPETPMKLVAADLSRFEEERWVANLVLAPAERYVVEVRFQGAGETVLVNRVEVVDHAYGRFVPQVDTLSRVAVSRRSASPDLGEDHTVLRRNEEVAEEIGLFRSDFERPVDHHLHLSVRLGRLPVPLLNFIQIDTLYSPPVEWGDGMPHMNWISTAQTVQWVLQDPDTGLENMEVDWTFRTGDVVRLRIFNDPRSPHPMQHPIHIHGQRFLVFEVDGAPRTNLAWKDTVLIPSGSSVDLLVEMSNPGRWMLHCHILEHIGADMMMAFTVIDPDEPGDAVLPALKPPAYPQPERDP